MRHSSPIHHVTQLPCQIQFSPLSSDKPNHVLIDKEAMHVIDVFCLVRQFIMPVGAVACSSRSIGATANVLQQRAEHGATEYDITPRASQFGKGVDQDTNAGICVFCVRRVPRVDSRFGEYAPHMELRSRILLPKIRLESCELLWSPGGPDDVETPRASLGTVARTAFEVLGLNLGIFAEGEEDVECKVVEVDVDGRRLLNGKATKDHG